MTGAGNQQGRLEKKMEYVVYFNETHSDGGQLQQHQRFTAKTDDDARANAEPQATEQSCKNPKRGCKVTVTGLSRVEGKKYYPLSL